LPSTIVSFPHRSPSLMKHAQDLASFLIRALLQIQGACFLLLIFLDDHYCVPFYREGTTDRGWAAELARCGVDPSRPLESFISICLGYFPFLFSSQYCCLLNSLYLVLGSELYAHEIQMYHLVRGNTAPRAHSKSGHSRFLPNHSLGALAFTCTVFSSRSHSYLHATSLTRHVLLIRHHFRAKSKAKRDLLSD